MVTSRLHVCSIYDVPVGTVTCVLPRDTLIASRVTPSRTGSSRGVSPPEAAAGHRSTHPQNSGCGPPLARAERAATARCPAVQGGRRRVCGVGVDRRGGALTGAEGRTAPGCPGEGSPESSRVVGVVQQGWAAGGPRCYTFVGAAVRRISES
jgi:hypothetical protein